MSLLRLDGIAFTGAEITPYYDSLLGKASSVASLVQVQRNQQQTLAVIENQSSQSHLNSR
jgi:pyruvate carboxylase